jgi:hypothetical protein
VAPVNLNEDTPTIASEPDHETVESILSIFACCHEEDVQKVWTM